MTIVTTNQSLNISNVRSVVVTEIVQDTETQQFIREIRIFGEVEGESGIAPLICSIRVSSATRSRIHISVPASEF